MPVTPAERRNNMGTRILVIILVCMAIFAVIVMLSVCLTKKKKDASGVLSAVDTGIGYAQAIAEALKPFLPGIAGGVIDLILKYASQAVKHVEATYKAAIATGANANDTRAAEATSLIKSGLALEGVEDTAQIDKLIGTIIPLLVLALPKTHELTATAQAVDPAQT